jgi:uncharacterized protein (DUF2062 family)
MNFKDWMRRRISQPIYNQLKQGANPRDLAISCAVGVACGSLPFFGFTTLVGLLIGHIYKLNQPALQSINYLMAPVQLMSIVFYGYLAAHIPPIIVVDIHPQIIVAKFFEGFRPFMAAYGMLGLRALILWLLIAPVYSFVVFYFLNKAFRRFRRKEVLHERT